MINHKTVFGIRIENQRSQTPPFEQMLLKNVQIILLLTRRVKLNNLNFDVINVSVKEKFIDVLHQS
jgi:hypothetical protein